jgi:hypothetical protein
VADGSELHPSDLEGLAIRRFGEHFSDAERRLLHNAPIGDITYCGPNRRDDDPDNDPVNAGQWGHDREIRAELITWLCVDREASKRVDQRGLGVHAAKITGSLALSLSTVPFSLSFSQCGLTGEADMTSMKIPQLTLIGSRTKSLLAEGADIKYNLLLQKVVVEGEVRLIAAQIGMALNCKGSTFRNRLENTKLGKAFDADRIRVEGGIFLHEGFSAEGEVRMSGARASTLSFAGSFRNPSGFALLAENAKVDGNVFLGLSADGVVDLFGIQVGGSLKCQGGTFGNLILRTAVVRGVFVWQGVHCVRLDLGLASAGTITDERAAWPDPGHLILDGLVYQGMSDCPTDAKTRLEWIDRQGEFKPQPYRQLAKVLREMGDDDGAKQVLFELQSRTRAEDRRRFIHSPVRWLFQSGADVISYATVGYGVYPEKAFWGLCGFTVLGWIVHRRAQRVGAMAPTDQSAYERFHADGVTPRGYPPFSPFIYSLENCVPLVKLGQDDRWQPDPNPNPQARVVPVATRKVWRVVHSVYFTVLVWAVTPKVLRRFRWIMILVGWVLATYFVAGLTGIIKGN